MLNAIMRPIAIPITATWVFLCGPQSHAASLQAQKFENPSHRASEEAV